MAASGGPELGSLLRLSQRQAEVALRFGLADSAQPPAGMPSFRIAPGQLVLITGPSGGGKTSALANIERQARGCIHVQRMSFSPDRSLIDGVAPWAPLGAAAAILTACGLGEPRVWVRPFAVLSEGEKFRARLAKALALQSRQPASPVLLCDEFGSGLHRRLVKAIAFNLRKLVDRSHLGVVVASSQEDFVADLRPHRIVRVDGLGGCHVESAASAARSAISLRRGLRVVPGVRRDYQQFAAMHYRCCDELGFVDKVFVLRETHGGVAGIIVYAHAPLELSLRNRATGGFFSGDPGRVNRHLRIIRRLVIHPDLRGCGLGHFLVRRTLQLCGTRFVECLASMGEFNPIFEKAGMTRVGQYGPSRDRQAAASALLGMGVDPQARDFVMHVCRRQDVREVVSRVVYDWYSGTTGGGDKRVRRQSPEFLAQTFRGLVGARPVYYLWSKNGVRRMPNEC